MWPFGDKRIAEREFERLLVRVPNPLGDQVMATPALAAVRARYPDARIVGHGSGAARALFLGDWFDDFIVSGRRDNPFKVARQLRPHAFDACLLLTGSFRSALPPFLARIPHRIGYRWSGRTALLTAHFPRPRPGGKKAPYPTRTYYLDLVRRLGAKTLDRSLRLPLADETRERADAWLRGQGIGPDAPILAMCVGAAFGPSKIWPAEYFAAVANHMAARHGARVLLLCGPGEEEIGKAVAARTDVDVVDTGLDPLPLDLLKGVIARARALITNDTGPRHIATAFGVPLVCLMGPTDPTYTEGDTTNQVVLRAEGVECSPCHLKTCPIDHRCLVRITPDLAIEQLERLWAA
jgi:heptosyltransferase-2